jgi:aminopeptidase N
MELGAPTTIFLKDYTVPPFLIETVDLSFDLNSAFTTVTSVLSIVRNPASLSLTKDLVLHGQDLQLISVKLKDELLTDDKFNITDESLTVLNVPEQFLLTIQTQIKPHENTRLSGLYQSSGNYCTQCEAEGFRRITYFLDRPDVMAKYTTTLIADQAHYPILLSNGNLIDSGTLAGGKHWAKWEDPFKKPSYLFALVAGDLECVEDHFITQSGRRVELKIYVERGDQDKCAHAMQAVKKAMRWDEQAFGREYDLDIYMIVAVSDFNMGAMENKGLNIFNTKYILAKTDTATDEDFIHVESVIAHEYFHNWTGNRITCRDWFQLSLKEGLTIFRDQSFTADTTSAAVARIHDVNALRTQQFPEDASPLAHAVRPESFIEINNFYTSTIYNKGAEVIRMMQTILGKPLFRKGMDIYFDEHDGDAVTINDFVKAMEDASGIDLTQFSLWYSQAGTPVVKVTELYDEIKQIYTLKLDQACAATPGQPVKQPFYIPIKIGLMDRDGSDRALESDVLHLTESSYIINFEHQPTKPIPSLLRAFSAPVKLQFDYSDQDLVFLFKHDSDPFNRWEGGQKYAINVLLSLSEKYQRGESLELSADVIQAYQQVLTEGSSDKWFLAELLILPSLRYLIDQMPVVDVDAMFAAREAMALQIAQQLQALFLKTYHDNHTAEDVNTFTIEGVGRRQLKNVCLSYLMLIPNQRDYLALGVKQFNQSFDKNMTDSIAALRSLTNVADGASQTAFDQHWQHDALVLDKWFSLQAISKLPNTLDHVKKLVQHPAFDIKNPNKVYALIGGFGQNLKNVHAIDGSGYAFLAEVVQQLDSLNPQVAARMIRPLVEWKRFDKQRQVLMQQQLNVILSKQGLSNDVFELVNKSLKN